MTSLITRCPKCATAFNVTEAHLSTANGAVRCGSCLNVFNGRENLTQTLKKTPASTLLDDDDDDDLLISDDLQLDDHDYDDPIYDAKQERLNSTFNRTNADDDFDDSDEDESWALKLLEEEGHNPYQLGLRASPITPSSQPNKISKVATTIPANKTKTSDPIAPAPKAPAPQAPAPKAPAVKAPVTKAPVAKTAAAKTAAPQKPGSNSAQNKAPAPTISAPQEISAEAIEKITQQPIEPQASSNTPSKPAPTQAANPIAAATPVSAPEAAKATPKNINPPAAFLSATPKPQNTTPYSADADTTPQDNAPQPTAAALKAEVYATTKALAPEPEPQIAAKDMAELQQELQAAQAQIAGQNAAQSTTKNTPLAASAAEQGKATHALLNAIEAEAVELQYTAKRSPWLGRPLWVFLALAATAALGAQIAWLKFDQLSLVDPYRQYYGMACQYLGCELPQRKDLNKIRTTNLLVRSHPNTEGALLVDLALQNHAKYEQPFPKLVLVFSNIKSKVVASRTFEPSEYLGGDLLGASLMPSQKSIHLSLELVDPGKGAVSYKISVVE